MKLGDRIKLHFEREPIFSDGKPEIVDGEFTVIGVKYGLPHCFGEDLWSEGFNCFEYGESEDGGPDIVLRGSVYVPAPHYLDKKVVRDLHCDRKTVSWEILP